MLSVMQEARTKMPPTPPPGSERRTALRYENIAQANVKTAEDIYLLTVRNLSASGAFLEGSPAEHPGLKPGAAIELVLSCSDPAGKDNEVINIRCQAHIARVDPGAGRMRPAGFGVALKPLDRHEDERLVQVLAAIARESAPLP